MKISDYIIIVLVIGMCFTAFGMIISDFETSYPDVEINRTSWEGKYNFADDINESAEGLKIDLEKIGDAEGFWTTISVGALAIPNVIISTISILLKSMGYGFVIFQGILDSLGVPQFVTTIGTIIIIILVLFAGISFYHRGKA